MTRRGSELDNAADPLAVCLQTAARRYCMERHALWSERYAALQRGREHRVPCTYTDRDLATFPRYNVLRAILLEVERIVVTSLTATELRELLSIAGRTAETLFTRPPQHQISADAMEEEREAFCAYVETVDDDFLWRVTPLPYRHVLSEAAAATVRAELAHVWGVEGYWFPLAGSRRVDVRAFRRDAFERGNASVLLRAAVEALGIDRVWQCHEDLTVLEIERASIDFLHSEEETFWTSPGLEWIVYVSHESTITIGGSLLAPFLAAWPDATAAGR